MIRPAISLTAASLMLWGIALADAHAHADRPAREGHAQRGEQRQLQPIALSDVREQASAAFARLDTDGDGLISLAEFLAAEPGSHRKQRGEHQHRFHQRSEREARRPHDGERQPPSREASFARLDRNQDGVLDRSEFPPRLARLEAMDSDGDGIVTPAERRAFMAQQRKLRQSQTE